MKLNNAVALAVICLALNGCQNELAKRFPPAKDFCAKENRKIPNDEKIARVLTRWYKSYPNTKNQSYFYQAEPPAYIRVSLDAVTSQTSPDAEIMQVIGNYIKRNPLCCQILKPDHLGNQIWNGYGWTDDGGYTVAHKWGYMSDLYIFTSLPLHKIDGAVGKKELSVPWESQLKPGKDAPGWAYMMNNCGEIQDFNRG